MNSPHSVESIVPEVAATIPTVKDCERELYCGFPYFLPVTTFLWYMSKLIHSKFPRQMHGFLKKISFRRKTSWIPGPAPLISIPTNLELISKAAKQNIVSFTFNVTGNALTNDIQAISIC